MNVRTEKREYAGERELKLRQDRAAALREAAAKYVRGARMEAEGKRVKGEAMAELKWAYDKARAAGYEHGAKLTGVGTVGVSSGVSISRERLIAALEKEKLPAATVLRVLDAAGSAWTSVKFWPDKLAGGESGEAGESGEEGES